MPADFDPRQRLAVTFAFALRAIAPRVEQTLVGRGCRRGHGLGQVPIPRLATPLRSMFPQVLVDLPPMMALILHATVS